MITLLYQHLLAPTHNKKDYQHDEASVSITVWVRVDKRVLAKSLLATTYHTDEMSSPLQWMKKG